MKFSTFRSQDSHADFPFRVEVEGLTWGSFSGAEGPTLTVEPIEVRRGDSPWSAKLPGLARWGNLTLRRGWCGGWDLWEWCKSAAEGRVDRRSISLVLLGDDRSGEVGRWNMFECWPCRWGGWKLDGSGHGLLVEEVEIAIEWAERG